jgi:glycosyltransferase involved in cell wall biosynthesis
MPQLYRSADILLHLSKDEPSSLALIEAMACGLPVIGHDIPRLRWVLGDEGSLVDTDDLAAVAREIEIVRDAAHSGQAGRVLRAQTFSWTRIGGMYRTFLQDIIASRK